MCNKPNFSQYCSFLEFFRYNPNFVKTLYCRSHGNVLRVRLNSNVNISGDIQPNETKDASFDN